MQQLSYIAAIFVIGGIASAAVVAVDLRQCRQPMRIMNSVWILTALWASFFGLAAYYAFGRVRQCTLEEMEERPQARGAAGSADSGEITGIQENSIPANMAGMRMEDMEHGGTDAMRAEMPGMEHGMEHGGANAMRSEMPGMEHGGTNAMPADGMRAEMPGMRMETMAMPARPGWQSVVLSTLHCGAGCTLADLVGEWFLYFVPVAIGGSMLAGSWVIDYLLALVFGIGFQYAAIRGMEPRTPRAEIVRRAAKADILSLTAWQAGMYGWMAVVIFVLDGGTMLPRTTFQFWFMMQIAMACGFLLALPVNVWLIRAGIKKGM